MPCVSLPGAVPLGKQFHRLPRVAPARTDGLLKTAAATVGDMDGLFTAAALPAGAGASVCAIKGGVCIDTSMGLTPLEG